MRMRDAALRRLEAMAGSAIDVVSVVISKLNCGTVSSAFPQVSFQSESCEPWCDVGLRIILLDAT
jgi:hypothetical protein